MRIRKQVYELTKADLIERPVWEFALDEEGDDNQDEATVRPWNGKEPPDPAERTCVVRATFTLADGTRYLGYLTPPVQGDSSVSTIQPIITTDDGQIMFWYGVMTPSAEMLRMAYKKLGRTPEQIFPIAFAADVKLVGSQISGSLHGFMHFRSFSDQTVVQLK